MHRVLWISNQNALETTRCFLRSLWERNELTYMLAPIQRPGRYRVTPQVIADPAGLSVVNPFVPVMETNAAPMLVDHIRQQQQGRVAAILKPCEVRAFTEIRKRRLADRRWPTSYDNGSPVIIGVDCPGTYPVAKYTRRVKELGADALTRRSLECRIIPSHLRTACQICDCGAPCQTDILIGTIGTAEHQFLLVRAEDQGVDARLRLGELTDQMATEQQIKRHKKALKSLTAKRTRRRRKLTLSTRQQSTDFGTLLSLLARCTLCADCLDACPLYQGELADLLGVSNPQSRRKPPLSEWVGVSRWMASCIGCGLCEEACSRGVPLTLILSGLSRRIHKSLRYVPGDPDLPLPWAAD